MKFAGVGFQDQPCGRVRSKLDSDDAFHFLSVVYLESLGRRAVDYGSGGDVESGAMALAHDRRPCKQAAGKRTCLVAASAEVVEGVEPLANTRNRDP
jgi:hypothetical protein